VAVGCSTVHVDCVDIADFVTAGVAIADAAIADAAIAGAAIADVVTADVDYSVYS